MEKVSLHYGSEMIDFNIDGAKSIKYLQENPMPIIEDIKSAFIDSLNNNLINSKPLKELINAKDKVTIIISDITRLWMKQDILCQILVEYLHNEMNVPFENMAVVIALGTHRGNSEDEKKRLASEFVYNNVTVVDHDCDATDLVYVGTTPSGTDVKVNPLIVGRKVIAIGATMHHIMAGYGGGRKSIVPGVAGRETVKMNHQRALDPEKPMSNFKVGSGRVKENPINVDMAEAAQLVDVTFGVNVVMDSHSRHSGFFCGDFELAWKESCRYVQKSYGLPIDYEADIVIASCGGFPKDLNLYQSTKTLFNACKAVKKGGTLIILAQCPEGSGAKDFFDWAEPLRRGCLDKELRENFTIGGYIFYAACEASTRAKTYLLSEIDPTLVKDMNLYACNNIEEILKNVDFNNKDVYIMSYGGNVMPQLKEDYEFLCNDI